MRTAVALRDAGLAFVLAPAAAGDGAPLVRLSESYSVAVFPFTDAVSLPFGEHPPENVPDVLHALGRLHATSVDVELPRADPLGVPHRAELLDALDDVDRAWASGPFAEATRALLAEHGPRVRTMLDAYEEHARAVRAGSDDWVITHGEPHANNVLRGGRGEWFLIDWDTVRLGPRERDLWMVPPKTAEDRDAYGGPAPDPDVVALFTRLWDLTEVAVYVAQFRATHDDDANTRAAFGYLEGYLAR